MRISDWSSDVCSSDLQFGLGPEIVVMVELPEREGNAPGPQGEGDLAAPVDLRALADVDDALADRVEHLEARHQRAGGKGLDLDAAVRHIRSEEHTSELQSLMRISYAVFCLKNKNNTTRHSH